MSILFLSIHLWCSVAVGTNWMYERLPFEYVHLKKKKSNKTEQTKLTIIQKLQQQAQTSWN